MERHSSSGAPHLSQGSPEVLYSSTLETIVTDGECTNYSFI